MIIDQFENLSRYQFQDENMEEARQYLLTHDVLAMEEKTHIIKEGEITLIFQDALQKSIVESKYEAHRQFVDIHIPLEGTDFIRSIKTSNLQVDGVFDTDNDFILGDYRGENYTDCFFTPGSFGIYFPEDAHLAKATTREPKKVKKFVMKVKLK